MCLTLFCRLRSGSCAIVAFDSLENVWASLTAASKGRLVAVLNPGRDRQRRSKEEKAAAAAAAVAAGEAAESDSDEDAADLAREMAKLDSKRKDKSYFGKSI